MDSPHAHPPSLSEAAPAGTLHSRSRSVNSIRLRDNAASITPRSVPTSRQQRILRARHARFSAQKLSLSGVGFSYPQLVPTNVKDSPDENQKTTGSRAERNSVSPGSAILSEISNSRGYSTRSPSKRAPIPIFQDSPARSHTGSSDDATTPTVYHEAASDVGSPTLSDPYPHPAEMGLREVSTNIQRTSPHPGSPSYVSPRDGSRRKSAQRKLRFDSEEYIQHIEKELEVAKGAIYSPTTHVPWKEKLRKAKDENCRLKVEIESMRSSFEADLQRTVEHMASQEARLQRRIRDLEDEMDLKDATIEELKFEHEQERSSAVNALKTRLEMVEDEKAGLEVTNRSMMKRNEVLTQLLAMSPTKANQSFELETPRRRNARPMSLIIPRLPSSPPGQTVPAPQRGTQSVVTSPAGLTSLPFSAHQVSSPISSPTGLAQSMSPRAVPFNRQSIDSGLGHSQSHSHATQESGDVTPASQSSESPDLPPLGQSPTDIRSHMLRQPSKRRPRKFMPGSAQLKPLLLPTFTAENGNLPSTSPITSPVRAYPVPGATAPLASLPQPLYHPGSAVSRVQDRLHRVTTSIDSSAESIGQPGPVYQSLDGVFAQHSGSFSFDDLRDAPGARSSQHPVSHSSRQLSTLSTAAPRSAFESPNYPDRVDSWIYATPSVIDAEALDLLRRSRYGNDTSPVCKEGRGTPSPSTSDIIGKAEIPRPLFSRGTAYYARASAELQHPLHIRPPSEQFDSPVPANRHRKSHSTGIRDSLSSEIHFGNRAEDPGSQATFQGAPHPNGNYTNSTVSNTGGLEPGVVKRRSLKARSPLQVLQQRSFGSRPLASITIQAVYATLSRYTTYIQTFKRDPWALARRVLANAWRSNWNMLGKMSWWVLGLFLGHRAQVHDRSAWDWDNYDGESIAHRYCNSSGTDGDRLLSSDESAQASNPTQEPLVGNEQSERSHEGRSKPGWGNSLLLWGKFSVAIMLAVGGAVVKGPAEMLRDIEERRSRRNSLDESLQPATESGSDCRCFGRGGRAGHPGPGQFKHGGAEPRLPVSSGSAVTRMTRSHSSPSPKPRQEPGMFDGARVRDQVQGDHIRADENEHDDRGYSENDLTLKPVASERKHVESIFDPCPWHEPRASDNGGGHKHGGGANVSQVQDASVSDHG